LPVQNRPLSPHLQIYRPQLTSVLSILHRGTGFVIAMGALLFAWWLWSITNGPASYQTAYVFFNSWFGKLLLFVWTLCTFYHLCNGIRHLVWDAGYGFELDQVCLSGQIALGGSVVLTMLTWLI